MDKSADLCLECMSTSHILTTDITYLNSTADTIEVVAGEHLRDTDNDFKQLLGVSVSTSSFFSKFP